MTDDREWAIPMGDQVGGPVFEPDPREEYGPVVGYDEDGTPLNRDGNPPQSHPYWTIVQWPYREEEDDSTDVDFV